jgi:hypothetical protein
MPWKDPAKNAAAKALWRASEQGQAYQRQYYLAKKAKRYAETGVPTQIKAIAWNKEVPARRRWITYTATLKWAYGLSFTGYLAMLHFQDYRCARCRTEDWGTKLNRPCVDHDHSTKVVRGLLCQRCNLALGMLGDDYSSALLETERSLNYLRDRRGV